MTHTSTEQPELLPCPFCGTKPTLSGRGTIRWIKCSDEECGNSGMAVGISADELEKGINAWNRRTPESQAQRVPLNAFQRRAIFDDLYPHGATSQMWQVFSAIVSALERFYITQEKQG